MRKLGVRALACSLAVMMVAGMAVPAAASAADKDLLVTAAPNSVKTLYITADMVDADGEIVISGEDWDRIVITKEAAAKDIYLDQVNVGELVVESGSPVNIQIWEAKVTKLTVKEPELADLAMDALLPLLADEETQNIVLDLYEKNQAKKEQALSKAPTIVTMGDATIGEVVVNASATLDFEKGSVGAVNLEANGTLERAKVTLKNYEGDVTYKGSDSFNMMELRCVDSDIKNLKVDGTTDKNYLNVSAKNSSVDKAEVAANANIALNIATDKLEVSEKASGASLSVLNTVKDMDVKASDAEIEVTSSGKVSSAVIAGDNVKVSGVGNVAAADITGKNVSVSTFGTEVEGENAYESSSVEKIVVTDIDMTSGGATINKNTNGSVTLSFPEVDGLYKSATYTIPKSIPKNRIATIVLDITSASQFGITLTAGKGSNIASYPGYGVSESRRGTYTFAIDTATTMISSISLQSLSSGTPDITLHSITFYLAPEKDAGEVSLWTTWTEDFADAKLNKSLLTTGGDLNWATYEYVAEGYGKVSATASWQGMCIVLDNTDSSKDADFTVSAKIKKVDGNNSKIKFQALGDNYKDWTQTYGNLDSGEWETVTTKAVTVEAGKGYKLNLTPYEGQGNGTLTYYIDDITVTRAFKDASAGSDPTPTPTPAPAAAAPSALPDNYLVYTLADLTKGGYGYTLSDAEHGGTKVELNEQYQELQLTLPTAAKLADYEKMIVTISSATDAIAVKAGEGVWYDQSATETTDLTFTLADKATADVSVVGLMANNAACEFVVYRVAFVPKTGTSEGGTGTPTATPTPTPTTAPTLAATKTYAAAELTFSVPSWNSGTTATANADDSVTIDYTGNYHETRFALSDTIKAGEYEKIAVTVSGEGFNYGVELLDAEGKVIAFWWGQSAGTKQETELAYDKLGYSANGVMNDEQKAKTIAYVSFKNAAEEQTGEMTVHSIKFVGTDTTTPTPTPTPAPSATVSIAAPTTTTLTLDDTLTLVATASNGGTITWSSSAESVATVDASGKVTPVSGGTVTITATCGSASATVDLTIEKAFYLKNAEAFSLTVGSDNSVAVLSNYYMNGTNFSGKLPDVLKNDATMKAKFETMSGIVEVVKAFEFSVTFTEATKKTNSWEPQVECVVQGNGTDGNYASSTYKNQWVNVGEPATSGTATGTTTFYVANQTFDDASAAEATWADLALGQLAVTVKNAAADSAVVGTYSIKVILN